MNSFWANSLPSEVYGSMCRCARDADPHHAKRARAREMHAPAHVTRLVICSSRGNLSTRGKCNAFQTTSSFRTHGSRSQRFGFEMIRMLWCFCKAREFADRNVSSRGQLASVFSCRRPANELCWPEQMCEWWRDDVRNLERNRKIKQLFFFLCLLSFIFWCVKPSWFWLFSSANVVKLTRETTQLDSPEIQAPKVGPLT